MLLTILTKYVRYFYQNNCNNPSLYYGGEFSKHDAKYKHDEDEFFAVPTFHLRQMDFGPWVAISFRNAQRAKRVQME